MKLFLENKKQQQKSCISLIFKRYKIKNMHENWGQKRLKTMIWSESDNSTCFQEKNWGEPEQSQKVDTATDNRAEF
jgi:hypothetical protein